MPSVYIKNNRGGMSAPWGDGCSMGIGVPGGMSVPGGWEFQGDECSRRMSVLGDGCLGGWEFLLLSACMVNSFLQFIADCVYCSAGNINCCVISINVTSDTRNTDCDIINKIRNLWRPKFEP